MYENYYDASEMLRRRTSKILGGGVSEKLFLDRFIIPNNISYSKGWWFSKSRDSNRTFFFIVKNNLSSFDYEIINVLVRNNHTVCQIVCRENDFVIVSDGITMTIEAFCNSFDIKMVDPHPTTRHEGELLDKCIEFYNQNRLLTEEAQSIHVEDYFLNRFFFTTNIDLFIKNPNTQMPVCIEIKFKNEFLKDGILVFGVDLMQYDGLFPLLRNCEIEVYTCVLYNYLKQNHNIDTTEIFNFLELCEGNMCWKKKQLVDGENHRTHEFRNQYTAWYGDEGRTVHCIPLSEYTSIGASFFDNNTDNYWGPCSENGCDGFRVIRRRNFDNVEFMGCTSYWKHK